MKFPTFFFVTTSAVIVLLSLGRFADASDLAPKSPPEMQKYAPILGVWNYEGQAFATPIGKAGKMSGTVTNRMILGGSVMESRWRDHVNPDFGSIEGLDLHIYDAKAKKFTVHFFDASGSTSVGSETPEGRTWSGSSMFTGPKGEAVKVRTKFAIAEDGNTAKGTWELSVDDGKTWQPWFSLTDTKVRD